MATKDTKNQGLRPKQVAERLDCSVPTVYRLERTNPKFPRRQKISPRLTIYDSAQLEAFIAGTQVAGAMA